MGKLNLSVVALILANLVPLFGVLFFSWDHTLVIALFWIENLIIGGFNLLRMFTAIVVNKNGIKIFHPLFFLFHYGMFCSAHGLILWDILKLGDQPQAISLFGYSADGILQVFGEGIAVLQSFVALHSPIIWLGIVSLLLSRSVSFIENFVLKGEVFTATPRDLMVRPYSQIVVMHAGIIFGGLAIDKFGSSVWLLFIIVAFKIAVDIRMHLRQHSANSKQADQATHITEP